MSATFGRPRPTPGKRGQVPALDGEAYDFNVFCPKCGQQMALEDDHWRCVRGDMALSIKLERDLVEWCSAAPGSHGDVKELSFQIGGEWWCPLDGTRMEWSDDGYPICPNCGRILGWDLLYPLIELHPHVR
jgi:hypothetical protein